MLLFDLSHDRMATRPFEVVEDVQAAMLFDENRYLDGARKIGLNAQEREEFLNLIMAGRVALTTLPTHLDAMAGMHRGRIYAVRNVRVRPGEQAFVIALADGKRVYVPMKCGNVSVVQGAPRRVVVHVRTLPPTRRVAAVHAVAPPPVVPAPPAPVAPPPVAVVNIPTPVAPIVEVAHARNFALPFFGWLAGSIGHVVTGGSPPLPSCGVNYTTYTGACVGH